MGRQISSVPPIIHNALKAGTFPHKAVENRDSPDLRIPTIRLLCLDQLMDNGLRLFARASPTTPISIAMRSSSAFRSAANPKDA